MSVLSSARTTTGHNPTSWPSLEPSSSIIILPSEESYPLQDGMLSAAVTEDGISWSELMICLTASCTQTISILVADTALQFSFSRLVHPILCRKGIRE